MEKWNLQASGVSHVTFWTTTTTPEQITLAGDTNMTEAKASSTVLIVDTAYRRE